MNSSFNLKDVQTCLKVKPHVLIHLCEQGVIIPEKEDTAGRGNWRTFSALNMIEFAIAVELGKFGVPIRTRALILRICHKVMVKIEAELGSLYQINQKSGKSRFEIRLYEGVFLQFDFDSSSKPKSVFEISNGNIRQTSTSNVETMSSFLSVDVFSLIDKIKAYANSASVFGFGRQP